MSICHASEYLSHSEPAFFHAVGIASGSHTAVSGIHIAREPAPDPSPPPPYGLLERWGKPRAGVPHRWYCLPNDRDVAERVVDLVTRLEPELLVLTTHGRAGLERLSSSRVAERIARRVVMPVLLVPHDGPFLVSAQTGAVSLRRVLLVAGPHRDAQRAADALALLAALANVTPDTVEFFHIEEGTAPVWPTLPPSFDVTHHTTRGPIERAVAQHSTETDPSLLVMTTHGHDQLSDLVFASHTERVLHATRRPLLWSPCLSRRLPNHRRSHVPSRSRCP